MNFRKPRNTLEGNTRTVIQNTSHDTALTCPRCKKLSSQKELLSAYNVCLYCGYHFRMTARQRVSLVCDMFTEIDSNLKSVNAIGFPGYDKKLASAREESGEQDAVICGFGEISGYSAAVFAMEPYFMMGSMGSVVGEKITRLFEAAVKRSLPVVGFIVSGGARMQEGILSLMQMAKTSGAVKKHSDNGGLYIAVLTDPTTGGVTASFAMQADIILAEPHALIGFAGPRVIEQTIKKKLPQGFQRAEFLSEKGFVDDIIDRRNLKEYISKSLKLHGSNVKEFAKSQASAAKEQSPAQNAKENRITAPLSAEDRLAQAEKAYERVQRARAKGRVSCSDFINRLITDFTELHGDRAFSDDRAVITGVGFFNGLPVTVIGIEKGRSIKERAMRNFGMPHPEGYRKALRQMKAAEKFNRPVICFIDTPGAFCGIGAEERGQGQAIAQNLIQMMTLKTPIVSVIIGEGGSGGALGLAVADNVFMLENSVYSVISPEGCASILWKDSSKVKEASGCLKLTAGNLKKLGVIEKIIKENDDVFINVKTELVTSLSELIKKAPAELTAQRYQRFREIGVYE